MYKLSLKLNTKPDNSFNNNRFAVGGFKLGRRDRTAHGGGIMPLVRADLPNRRKDIECIGYFLCQNCLKNQLVLLKTTNLTH